MRRLNKTIENNDGAALIIVMLVLVAVTALGITAINISTTEVNLAGNDKFQKFGFYNGDSGFHGSPSVIYPNLNEETDAPLPPANPGDPNDDSCLQYINGLNPVGFYNLIYASEQPPLDVAAVSVPLNKDISFRNCDVNADIDITPRGAREIAGGGVEFAASSEGVGASGSKAKLYLITSTGDGAGNSRYTVRGHYRWTLYGGGLR